MDESLLPKLKRCTREVVNKASKPGGLLDKGEFTMAVARELITREMGLKEGDLDGKEWKKVVKEEVTAALVCPSVVRWLDRSQLGTRYDKGYRGGGLINRKNQNHRNPSLNQSRSPRWRLKPSPSLNQLLSLNQRRKQNLNRVPDRK